LNKHSTVLAKNQFFICKKINVFVAFVWLAKKVIFLSCFYKSTY